MRDRIQELLEWRKINNRSIAIATVVKTYGSAPQPLGSVMIINDQNEFYGSVSGGCVEGDVIRHALGVMRSGVPELVEYGISDDSAWGIGLACGGSIGVFIEPYQPIHDRIIKLLQKKQFFTVITLLNGRNAGKNWIIFPDLEIEEDSSIKELGPNVQSLVQSAWTSRKPVKTETEFAGETVEVFCKVYSPPARLLIIGAVHIAIPLVDLAKMFDFETVVIDARSAFATRSRFPNADHLIHAWPADALKELEIDENTFIAFLSHDEKMDNPALQVALASEARYIGALGSRKTHAKRVKALLEAGVEQSQLKRIHAPIGLEIGAVGAEQIALSVMSELIGVCNSAIE